MKLFKWFCLLFLCSSYGNIEKHLKKAEGKTTHHSLGNIDFIYMINLDQRPEKWEQSSLELASYGIYPYRFSAVNGWELSLEAINDVCVEIKPGMTMGFKGTSYPLDGNFKPVHGIIDTYNKKYFSHCMSRGAIGIILSHVSILQDAYDSGYKIIWIMEDDIQVIEDPRQVPYLIQKLTNFDKKWDILFTDPNTKNNKGKYVKCRGLAKRANFNKYPASYYLEKFGKGGKEFSKIGMRYGAYSMILKRKAIKKILDFYKKYLIFLPYDMDYWLVPDLRMYTTKKDIVSTRIKALSDNGGPNYLKKNK